jgi:hypothetical protein
LSDTLNKLYEESFIIEDWKSPGSQARRYRQLEDYGDG